MYFLLALSELVSWLVGVSVYINVECWYWHFGNCTQETHWIIIMIIMNIVNV